MYKCVCGKEFEKEVSLKGHEGNCEVYNSILYGNTYKLEKRRNVYLDKLKIGRDISANNAKIRREEKLAKWIEERHTCERCGKVMTEKYATGRFCSSECAHKRPQTEETKKKIRENVLKSEKFINSIEINNHKYSSYEEAYYENPKICKYCGKVIPYHVRNRNTCSDECEETARYLGAIKGGKISSSLEVKRSKNEIYFCELCEKYFKDVKHNLAMFNGWDADVIIEDIKYAILWNGPWHYKKITKKHSLKQVQNRDNIKLKEIEKCGYIPYVIKDMGRYNKKFVEEQFNIFIATLG